MEFNEIWRNPVSPQLSRPEREKVHFRCPVSVARIENDEFYIISMFPQEIYVDFMYISWNLHNFFKNHSFSPQGGNVAVANGIYYVLGVQNGENQLSAHFH